MIHKTLYHEDENGNTRVWWMESEGDLYRTHSGIKEGAIVTSEWTVAIPTNVGKKNERLGPAQALAEVKAEYKKKLERKYHKNEADISKGAHYFEPMLAEKYKGWKDGECFTQPKLDGGRCIAKKDGLWSRQGKRFVSVPHIEMALAPVFEKYPDLILDGELYNHALKDDFNTIMSLIRKAKPTAEELLESRQKVQYHVYDLIDVEFQKTLDFGDRYDLLDNLVSSLQEPSIKLVETWYCSGETELDDLYSQFLQDGYEGQMIRLDAPYENKRSKTLLKRKEFIDEEFEVSAILEGQGNWSGYAKACEFILPGDKRLENGERPKAGIKGSQEFTRELLSKEKPTFVTVRYQNLTPIGIPRFPIAVNFFWGERDI
ncbi:MAG: hypothetical protein P4M11_01935 [Candidatus Pacebacteria bacterium]|nr:hypothetical protein [Candidatus Paceibacterota bacterium]